MNTDAESFLLDVTTDLFFANISNIKFALKVVIGLGGSESLSPYRSQITTKCIPRNNLMDKKDKKREEN